MTLSQAAELVAYSAFSFHSEPQAEAKIGQRRLLLAVKQSNQ